MSCPHCIGDRVEYVGSVPEVIFCLKGKTLTVKDVRRSVIGCVADGEGHLRFLPPSELQLELDF